MPVHPQAREDEVVVRLVNLKQTKGGIIIPNAKEHQQRWAQVVSVGSGAYTNTEHVHHSGLAPGDVVLVARNAGQAFVLGGIPYLVVSQHSLPVVLKRDDGSEMPAAEIPKEELEPIERAEVEDVPESPSAGGPRLVVP